MIALMPKGADIWDVPPSAGAIVVPTNSCRIMGAGLSWTETAAATYLTLDSHPATTFYLYEPL